MSHPRSPRRWPRAVRRDNIRHRHRVAKPRSIFPTYEHAANVATRLNWLRAGSSEPTMGTSQPQVWSWASPGNTSRVADFPPRAWRGLSPARCRWHWANTYRSPPSATPNECWASMATICPTRGSLDVLGDLVHPWGADSADRHPAAAGRHAGAGGVPVGATGPRPDWDSVRSWAVSARSARSCGWCSAEPSRWSSPTASANFVAPSL